MEKAQRVARLVLLLVLHCVALIAAGTQSERSFDGFSVLRLNPDTREKLDFLVQLEKDFDNDLSYYQKLDFWSRPRAINNSVDLMVAPDLRDDIQRMFRTNNFPVERVIDDVQKYDVTA